MTLEEFGELTVKDLKKLSVPELKSLVSEQGKKLNKRVSRLRSDKVSHDAYDKFITEGGGKFSVKGKDTKAKLIDEAIREQSFNREKTSRYKEARKEKVKRERIIDQKRRQRKAEAEGKSKKEIAKIKGKSQDERVRDWLNKGVKSGKYKKGSKKYNEMKKLATENAKFADDGFWSAFTKWREGKYGIPYDGRKDLKIVFNRIEKKHRNTHDLKNVTDNSELFKQEFEEELKKLNLEKTENQPDVSGGSGWFSVTPDDIKDVFY